MANQHPVYRIVSMSKSRATRPHRRAGAARGETKQYVLGGTRRLLPERDVMISHADLLAHRDELLDRSKRGLLEVRTNDGRRVNLTTLEVGTLPPPPTPPAPPDFSLEAELRREPPKSVVPATNTVPLTPEEASSTVAAMAGVTAEEAEPPPVLEAPEAETTSEPALEETAFEAETAPEAEPVLAPEVETSSDQGTSRRSRRRGG